MSTSYGGFLIKAKRWHCWYHASTWCYCSTPGAVLQKYACNVAVCATLPYLVSIDLSLEQLQPVKYIRPHPKNADNQLKTRSMWYRKFTGSTSFIQTHLNVVCTKMKCKPIESKICNKSEMAEMFSSHNGAWPISVDSPLLKEYAVESSILLQTVHELSARTKTL